MSTPDIYAGYIKSLIDSEEARKVSLEQRGIGVVTTSSALATLLFAFVGVVTAAKNFALPASSHGYLIAAIALFAAAVALGMLANVPVLYKEGDPTPVQLAKVWRYVESEAQAHVIGTRLNVLQSARRSNALKGRLVLLSAIVQLAALVVLVFGALAILSTSPNPIKPLGGSGVCSEDMSVSVPAGQASTADRMSCARSYRTFRPVRGRLLLLKSGVVAGR